MLSGKPSRAHWIGPFHPPMRIGLISDTHGYLDPKIGAFFAEVEHIIHAGDIGYESIISALEEIAPATAVLGNTDYALPFRKTEVLQLGTRTLLVHHIVDPRHLPSELQSQVRRANPDVVVFGHTHKPYTEKVGSTLFINPGYAGKQRFDLPRSVAVLNCSNSGMVVEHYYL